MGSIAWTWWVGSHCVFCGGMSTDMGQGVFREWAGGPGPMLVDAGRLAGTLGRSWVTRLRLRLLLLLRLRLLRLLLLIHGPYRARPSGKGLKCSEGSQGLSRALKGPQGLQGSRGLSRASRLSRALKGSHGPSRAPRALRALEGSKGVRLPQRPQGLSRGSRRVLEGSRGSPWSS